MLPRATKDVCFAVLLLSATLATTDPGGAQTPQEQRWCDGEEGATPSQRIDPHQSDAQRPS
jgi:hypothetical protein